MATILEPDSVVSALDVATDLTRYYPTEAAIKKMADDFLPLKISGPDDTKGAKVVHEARMVVKNLRVAVDKTRKALKAPVLELGSKIDSVAKGILNKLEPIETYLENQEDEYEAAKEKIKQAAAEAKRLALQKRIDAMTAYGVSDFNPLTLADMSDQRFAEELANAKTQWEIKQTEVKAAEAKRLSEEAAKIEAQRIESERLAKERAELDAERAAQKAEADRLAAEAKRLADIEAARLRAEELKAAEARAAEQARIDTEAKIERERLAKEAKAKQDEAARLRAEALRPDKEKVLAVADAVAAIPTPTLSFDSLKFMQDVNVAIKACENRIREIASKMN